MICRTGCFSNVGYYCTYFFRVACIALVGLSKKTPWIFGHLHLGPNLHFAYTLYIGVLSVLNDSTRSVPSSLAAFWTRYRPFVSVHTLRCASILALVEGFKITGISSHRTPTKFSYSTLSDICYVRRHKVKLSLGLIKHHPVNTHGGMEVYSINSQPRHKKVDSCHLKPLNVEIRVYVGLGLTVRVICEALNCLVSARHVSVFVNHSIRQKLCVCVFTTQAWRKGSIRSCFLVLHLRQSQSCECAFITQ
jgi:hypothetical protein